MNTIGKVSVKRVLILGAFSLVLLYSCKTHYKTARESFTLIQSPSSMERGENLAFNVCGGCHNNHQLNKFVGHQLHDLPKFMGKVYSANITNSKLYGETRHYTDAQLAYLIRTGIKHDGRFIPYMVRPTMAADDINDIIVYLRSNEGPVTPGDTLIGKTRLSMLGKLASKFQKPQPEIEGIKRPDANDAVANGRYLIDIVGCYHCHSKGVLGLNYVNPQDSKGYMQGGMKFKTLEGKRVRGANLTPHTPTGIGSYTKEDFRKAVREGEAPHGRKLNYPMPKFKHLTDKQVDDMYTYLQTLTPKEHKTR